MVSGQSEEDFFSGASMPRNRELMRIFKDLDLVEQLGSGMNRILRSYDRSIFRISEHFIRVAFPFAESPNENDPRNRTDETVNDTVQKRVKDIIRRVPAATYQYIAEKSGVSRATVARAIKHMVEAGEIKREGTDRKGSWRILK